ncbi:50S ribosomal protein L2, partial [Pseudomonas aeruginosa]
RSISGGMRKVLDECRASLVEVSNSEHRLRLLGRACDTRLRGVRPIDRGVASNPVVPLYGGGECRTSVGRHLVSPWGLKTKGK